MSTRIPAWWVARQGGFVKIEPSWSSCTASAPGYRGLLDEAALAFVRSRQPKTPPLAAGQIRAELTTTSGLFDEHGWSTTPATYHRPPPEYLDTLRDDTAANAFRVVSPLAISPVVQRRAVFAGRADRLIPTTHSAALAQVWPHSSVHWYNGGHTGYIWSRESKAFVTGFLRDALCSRGRS